ncbi:MAG: phosphatase PAP2 family protein [Lachnospiraceae bacterium]|nr:phosphatase PAP2 family protein [Lachnospiraceae bacterium]
MSRNSRRIILPFVFLWSITWIMMIKFYDVYTIGPQGTEIGLSSLNLWFRDLFDYPALGFFRTPYLITEFIGYLSLLLCGFWGCIGIYQWVKEKDINAVDKTIFATGVLYAITIVLYVVFEKLVVNYRPIIMPGDSEVEPSFPSSHTMLSIIALGSTHYLIGYFLEDTKYKKLIRPLQIACSVLIAVCVIGRLVCGVHWFSDIVGGILISTTLLIIYSFFAEV